MQLGLLPLDNEIAILCHGINYLSGSFKRFQDGEFKDSSIGFSRQQVWGESAAQSRCCVLLAVLCWSGVI